MTLFEADDRLGGHADTHLVVPPAGPPIGVDTGFIVYNERNYPLLTRLFAELGVVTQPARMSMSVSCAGCGLRYAGKRGLAGPLLMTFILIRGTGARMTDRRMLASRPQYADYIARTSSLIPLPPKARAAGAAPPERA